MSGTSITNFTQAAQWVNELAEDLGWTQPRAYHLLRCVLHGMIETLWTGSVFESEAAASAWPIS